MAHKCDLLLLPTLSPSLDIIISLCLDLLINFFEELHILNVTIIIFFKTALDFSKILFNPRDLINVNHTKSIDQRCALSEAGAYRHDNVAKPRLAGYARCIYSCQYLPHRSSQLLRWSAWRRAAEL